MRLGRRLPRAFFERASTVVAPALLGRIIVRVLPDGTKLVARLVEVEAYAPDDPASHAFRGRTPRNDVMFGRAGHLYVYFTYGMHFCANVVTGSVGEGSAVLLRAAEPLEGLARMAAHRGVDRPALLCSGPARLAEALAIGRADNGADLVRGGAIRLHEGVPVPRGRVARGVRVGVNAGTDLPWRYAERGSTFVSAGRPGPARRPASTRRAVRG